MTREIPLSLQVFHSLNEYKAHRQNRTEQLRLRDLEGALKREEKLYTKEYALHKSKMHGRIRRRFSEPATSQGGVTSNQTRSSVFSAPPSLRRFSSSAMASRMYESLGEMSTSTRFQRIQRKFSIANLTERGVLTAQGRDLAEDIVSVRQLLFEGKPGRRCFTAIGQPRSEGLSDRLIEEEEEEEEEEEAENAEEKGKDSTSATDVSENAGSLRDNDVAEAIARSSSTVAEKLSRLLNRQKCSDTNTINSDTNSQEATDSSDKMVGTDIMNEPPRRSSLSSRLKPSLVTPILKPTTPNQGGNHDNSEHNNPIGDNSTLLRNQDPGNKPTSNTKSAQTPRKRVSIATPPDFSHDFESTDSVDGNFFGSSPKSADDDDDGGIIDWKSIFTRHLAKPVDPLQEKVKQFLSKQKDFNKLFPTGPLKTVETSTIHKELVAMEKAKKEKQKERKKKKADIVAEVLDKLEIQDENIRFHYQKIME